jgi:hypothetical protein
VDFINNATGPTASHVGLCQGPAAFANMTAQKDVKAALDVYMKVRVRRSVH